MRVFVPESRVKLNADSNVDFQDFGGFEEFGRKAGFDKIIMNHPQALDAFYPCVHDKMGGRFASLGVDIVDMIVKGDLIPIFGHLQ